MNMEKVASELLDSLNKDVGQSEENIKTLQGAMRGVQLLFQKLQEEIAKGGKEEMANGDKVEVSDDKDSKSGPGKKAKKEG